MEYSAAVSQEPFKVTLNATIAFVLGAEYVVDRCGNSGGDVGWGVGAIGYEYLAIEVRKQS